MEKIWTEHYDINFSKIKFYQDFPEFLPLIGSEYIHQNKKVIFIGESHYLPPESTIHLNSEKWYSSSSKSLNSLEKDWINTRNTSGSGINQKYKSKAFSIFRNIENAILESGFNPNKKDNMFRYCSYYNYFLRPAETGISIKRNNHDKDLSFQNFLEINKIMNFKYVIFTSKIAFNDFNWYYLNRSHNLDIMYFGIPHPSSAWYYRKSASYKDRDGNPLSGKEKLISIIKEHKLFQK